MIKPNLPDGKVKTVVVSVDITPKIQKTLADFGIECITLNGKMNCDPAVKNHPDLYLAHLSCEDLLYFGNECSMNGSLSCNTQNVNVLLNRMDKLSYKEEVMFNCVSIGGDIICNSKLIHPEILRCAQAQNKRIISVNQGYTKCNVCVVDEKSVITEDKGICHVLRNNGYDVLLLQVGFVALRGHEYGFIGGASGKISKGELAFFGCIEKHPEFEKISDFLTARGIAAISLSDDNLTDFGSLIPIM